MLTRVAIAVKMVMKGHCEGERWVGDAVQGEAQAATSAWGGRACRAGLSLCCFLPRPTSPAGSARGAAAAPGGCWPGHRRTLFPCGRPAFPAPGTPRPRRSGAGCSPAAWRASGSSSPAGIRGAARAALARRFGRPARNSSSSPPRRPRPAGRRRVRRRPRAPPGLLRGLPQAVHAVAALGGVVACPGCHAGLVVDHRFSRAHAAYFGWPARLDLHR